MTRFRKHFWGLAIFTALQCATLSGQTLASAAIDTKGWLRTFDQPIGDAYILKPLSAFGTGPSMPEK
jgi:hypothetical protein